jgi:hypothetical protein
MRLRWNELDTGSSRPLPVVVLLGPHGSGKTETITAMNGALHGIVHVGLDFAKPGIAAATPDQLLTMMVYTLSGKWKDRPRADFARFRAVAAAAQAGLRAASRAQEEKSLRERIGEMTPDPSGRWLTDFVDTLASDAEQAAELLEEMQVDDRAKVGAQAATVAIKLTGAIADLRARYSKSQAARPGLRWVESLPRSGGLQGYDALLQLGNEFADDMSGQLRTRILADAFVADIRAEYPRLAVRDNIGCSTCNTGTPRLKHHHNWVLLLDNIEKGNGYELVKVLISARERAGRDYPLLIIGTAGQWLDLDEKWRPVWEGPHAFPERLSVPVLSEISYPSWQKTGSAYLPVLLEPLREWEIGRMLSQSESALKTRFVTRLSGGLPLAVRELSCRLASRELKPGARDILAAPAGGSDPADSDIIRDYLAAVLDPGMPEASAEALVGIAHLLAAPWIISHEALARLGSEPMIRTVERLRLALWGTTPGDLAGTPGSARLQPWIAAALTRSLARRPSGHGEATFEERFAALREDKDTTADPVRTAYCDLALGRVSAVVTHFTQTFNEGWHKTWIEQLRLVTRAPCPAPTNQDAKTLYEETICNLTDAPADADTGLHNVITRLVVALWAGADPSTVPDERLGKIAAREYRVLERAAKFPDGHLFIDAATAADRGVL